MSDHKERMEEAINQALNSREGNLLSIARTYFSELTAGGYLKICPGCEKREQTFRVFRTKAGHWTWGCHRPSCPLSFENLKADRQGDAIGMIANREGISRDEAVDKFLARCGVANPREELRETKATRKTKTRKPAPATPTPTPDPEAKPSLAPPPEAKTTINLDEEEEHGVEERNDDEPKPAPAPTADNAVDFSLSAPAEPLPPKVVEKTVWEDLYERLVLDTGDREDLKRKRGFTTATIDAAGYRSSHRDNRSRLAPLLDAWPHGLLLAEGIASRDRESNKIKISAQLCGLGLRKRGTGDEEDKWDWTNPILIPYRDEIGRIISIRPHKGGLSGKNFMREHGFELAFRASRTRTRLYTSFLFWNRPEAWKDTCVLTEGEHKANALAQCGIPACAVPGIQMPRNDLFFEEMVRILRMAGIRKVIVAYDNEDKSHKPDPWDWYDVDVYALFACHTLRGAGFHPSHCVLPEEWRVDGKADWDGALAKFKDKAAGQFAAALKKAKGYFPQTEIFGTNQRDRIIHCKLNRLIFKPQILTGGDEEEELARLFSKVRDPWRLPLHIRDLITELYDTRGCYYVRKKLDQKSLKPFFGYLKEIKDELAEIPADQLEETAELEAALAAVKHIIAGRPEILSDFTISCDFQVRTQSGEIHRLFRFRNKHGQVSDHIQVPPSACSTSTKFREFCMGVGNFNPKIGDKQLQELMQDLGTFSAWREIRELEMLGRDPDSNLWIMGDCAFTPDADLFAEKKNGQADDVVFADKHDIIWHDGIGYRIDPQDLAQFSHKDPPKFFTELGREPAEIYAAIKADPVAERLSVAKIFFQFSADMVCTYGNSSGLLALGAMLAYAMAPELLAKYHGHPGLWIHGRAFAGKSENTRFKMMMWGYDSGYRTFMLSGGTTAVAIDRAFAQYCDIPIHADEFRQDEADKNRIASLRGPFNRQSKSKGRMDQSNKTRSVQPMTSPVVTGEGVTNDSATLSRYIEVILAADNRLGTKDEQMQRYQRMLGDSYQYHRIIRFILLTRKSFAKAAMEKLEEFVAASDVIQAISSDRLRLSYGAAYAAFKMMSDIARAAFREAKENDTLGEVKMSEEDMALMSEKLKELRAYTIAYAKNAAADVTSINFVVKFWSDVLTFRNIDRALSQFIWFEWCQIDPETNRVTRTNVTQDQEGLVRCIILKPKELYAQYQLNSRQRGHEPELSLQNIRSECQNERYWVPAPKNGSRQAHRFSMGERGQIDAWVLRFDRMDATLQQIFSECFDSADDGQDDLPL